MRCAKCSCWEFCPCQWWNYHWCEISCQYFSRVNAYRNGQEEGKTRISLDFFVISSESNWFCIGRREIFHIIIPEMSEQMYVYILTNQSHRVFYTGVTNNLERRILEHKQKIDLNSFSARYNCNKLVYYESGGDPEWAIIREKQIENYRREKKIALVESQNLYWKDLSGEWYN